MDHIRYDWQILKDNKELSIIKNHAALVKLLTEYCLCKH